MWTRLSWRLASLPAIVSLSLVPTNVPLHVTLLACRWITRVYCPPRSHATFNCVNIPGGGSPVLHNRVRWSLLAALLCLLLDDFKRRLTMAPPQICSAAQGVRWLMLEQSNQFQFQFPRRQLPHNAASVVGKRFRFVSGRRVKRLLANKGAARHIYSDGYPAILATQIGQSGGQTERVGPVSCGRP